MRQRERNAYYCVIYSLDKISQLSSLMYETLKTIDYNNNNKITILKICTKTNWKKHEYWLHFDLIGHNNNGQHITLVVVRSCSADQVQKTICSCSANHSTAVPTNPSSIGSWRPDKMVWRSLVCATAVQCCLWFYQEVFVFPPQWCRFQHYTDKKKKKTRKML